MEKKIDIYKFNSAGRLTYVASTNKSKTCQEAIEKYSHKYDVKLADLRAYFSKTN